MILVRDTTVTLRVPFLISVQESTLYKKWQEFNKDEYKMRTKAHKFDIIKSKLWKPTDIMNYDLTVKKVWAHLVTQR